jgi:uncharacterized damage-inducible protein DinB
VYVSRERFPLVDLYSARRPSMYRTIDDFLADFSQENESTRKVLAKITDTALAQKVTPDGRTLGRLAWHVVGTLQEMPASAGLATDAKAAETPVPAHAADLAAGYDRAAAAVVEAVKEGWSDADLDGEIPLYGQTWKRGKVLSALILHEVHHRGQMTVLMRQAGLRVPGVYGPAREEWAAYDMPAQE